MDWITANGNQVSSVVLLLIAVYALVTEKVVPGSRYRKVVEELEKHNTTLSELVSILKNKPPEK